MPHASTQQTMYLYNVIVFLFLTLNALTLPEALSEGVSQYQINLESGAFWQTRNDVRIPPASGTTLEFDQFDTGPFFHYRAEFFYQKNEKHIFRAVYAPLSLKVTGKTKTPIIYDGSEFNANEDLTVRYRFDSYRLTYAYQLYKKSMKQFDLGITFKVRAAEIELEQNGTAESYSNVGVVPLIYLSYLYQLTDDQELLLTSDFAAASQGRALDFAAKIRNDYSPHLKLGAGLRILEGGADNEKVYTFSRFHYAVFDLVYSL